LGKDSDEVLSWPVSKIIEWKAHFELQSESPAVDEEELEDKLKSVLMPRKK